MNQVKLPVFAVEAPRKCWQLPCELYARTADTNLAPPKPSAMRSAMLGMSMAQGWVADGVQL